MRRRNGFTLLELILAMGLVVVVASALAASLYAAFKAKRSVDEAVESTRQTTTAGDLLEREIANCVPPTGVIKGPFEGQSDTIDFFTTGPEPKADVQGDVKEVQYAMVQDPAGPGNVLVRRVQTNVLAQVVQTPPDQVMCKDVLSLTFSYYDGTNWQDAWDSTAQLGLPMAVMVTLELAPSRPGEESRKTTRFIPLSCYKPQNQTTPQAPTTGGITG